MKTHFGVTKEQNAESLTECCISSKSQGSHITCVTSLSRAVLWTALPVSRRDISVSLSGPNRRAVDGTI